MSVNKLLRIFSNQHKPDIEALSAHLDGRLDAAQARAIKAHVAACDVCRPVLAQMQNLQVMLQAMPEVEAPRSFRLRQADVEAPTRVDPSRAGGSAAMRWAPAFGGMAAALFVVVMGADLMTRGGGRDAQLATSQADSRQAGSLAAEDTTAFDDSVPKTQGDLASAPPVGTTVEAATGSDEFLATPAPNAAGAAEAAIEPTGAPADGDVEIGVPNTGPGPGGPIPADEGLTGDNVPPEVGVDAVTAVAATAQVEAAPPSPVGELSAAASDSVEDDGEGNRSAYLIVEIVTAALAVGAGAAVAFWRIRRRGTT
jgi:predicted anti-sigma-YlaC factor YlaD